MKLQINKKHKTDISRIRSLIKDSYKYQDKLINHLATKLSIEKGSAEYDILWDYIMNDSKWMIEYMNKNE